jgi:predicted phosphodiesterase
MTNLYFGIVGDTRPANEDDTSGYPTAIIQKIYQDLNSASPTIPFVIGTGDYQFASTSGSQSAPQLTLYMAARGMYSGVVFSGMGNHECTGATASNCGSGNTDGLTTNYNNFLSMLLAPIGQSKPYYSVNINSTTGAWTAKFVFVAGNAWDSTQSSWLSSTLATSTTYTFVIRHESSSANTAPGVSPSDSIIAKYPCTLVIVGHTHTYEWESTNQVIVGNGGAPLTGSGNYGYGLVAQQSDGTITVDMVDYESGTMDSSFHRALTATGSIAK